MLKENNCQPKILYQKKISFRIEGEIKTFPDEEKQKTYTERILKEFLQVEEHFRWNFRNQGRTARIN